MWSPPALALGGELLSADKSVKLLLNEVEHKNYYLIWSALNLRTSSVYNTTNFNPKFKLTVCLYFTKTDFGELNTKR